MQNLNLFERRIIEWFSIVSAKMFPHLAQRTPFTQNLLATDL